MLSTVSGRVTDLKAIALRTINDQECCAFISDLMDYAIDRDQQFDDEWIAEVAGLRMLGDALFWYTDLDEETQESWKKLRKALLKEAKLRSGGAPFSNFLAVALPPVVTPAPAATPGDTSSADLAMRVGRIRVEAADPQDRGYLSIDLDEEGCVQATKEVRNALIVQYNTADDFPTLNIKNPSHENSALGIQWHYDPKPGKRHFCPGRLVIVRRAFPTTSSWTTVRGPYDTAVFLIQPNLSLLGFSRISSGRYLLDTYMYKGTDQPRICLWYYDPERIWGGVKFKIESL